MLVGDLCRVVKQKGFPLEITTQNTFGSISISANNSVIAQLSEYTDGVTYLFIDKCRLLNTYLKSQVLTDLKLNLFEKKGRAHRCKSNRIAVIDSNSYTASELEAISNIFVELTSSEKATPKKRCNEKRLNFAASYDQPLSSDCVALMAAVGVWDISELYELSNGEIYKLFNIYRDSKEIEFESIMFELLSAVKIARKNKEHFEAKKLFIDGLEVSLSRLARGRC